MHILYDKKIYLEEMDTKRNSQKMTHTRDTNVYEIYANEKVNDSNSEIIN